MDSGVIPHERLHSASRFGQLSTFYVHAHQLLRRFQDVSLGTLGTFYLHGHQFAQAFSGRNS